ncbi:MAG: CSLREA domain-containing protein [Bacteroidota bacterium]
MKYCLPIACLIFFTACSVDVENLTNPTATYNSPLNSQNFRAELKIQNVKICNVFLSIDGGRLLPMQKSPVGNLTYELDVPVPVCTENLDFQYQVEYAHANESGCPRSKTFPATGSHRISIGNQPRACIRQNLTTNQSFTVNTTRDLPDNNPGDGKCETGVRNASCSLRAAIMEANATAGLNAVIVPTGRYTLSRTKTNGKESDSRPEDAWGDLDITDALVIRGEAGNNIDMGQFRQPFGNGKYFVDNPAADNAFTKIDANGIDRVFQVHKGSGEGFVVDFEKIQVSGGKAIDRPGGGILNEGILRLERVVISENELAQQGGPGGVFSNNRALPGIRLGLLGRGHGISVTSALLCFDSGPFVRGAY